MDNFGVYQTDGCKINLWSAAEGERTISLPRIEQLVDNSVGWIFQSKCLDHGRIRLVINCTECGMKVPTHGHIRMTSLTDAQNQTQRQSKEGSVLQRYQSQLGNAVVALGIGCHIEDQARSDQERARTAYGWAAVQQHGAHCAYLSSSKGDNSESG